MVDRFLDEHIEVSDTDGVRTIRFASGHRLNPMTRWMVEELHRAITSVDTAQTRVVVLEGSPVFGCGAHLGELATLSAAELESFVERELGLASVVQDLPCLTVAALRGPCLGNAAELALACDLRIATEDTTLGCPEIKAGFQGPAHQLLRYVRPAVAANLLLTGESVEARTALDLGLVTTIVTDDAARDELVRAWARLDADAVQRTKLTLRAAERV